MRAKTLAEAFKNFNPRKPLQGPTLEAFYVERAGTPLPEMEIYLRSAPEPFKLLFTGHRGSGKTTSLFKLVERLGQPYFAVRFSVTETLNPFELTYVDLLLGLSTRLFAQATEEAAIKTLGLGKIADELLDEIYRWFTEYVLGKDIPFQKPPADKSLSGKVNFLTLELEAKVTAEARTRQKVRERVEMRLSELIERINYMLDAIRRHSRRDVLIVVEDIDKLDLKAARDLYLEHASSLIAPKASIIYTFPASLRYSNDFMQIRRNFDEAFVLPNVHVFHRDGTSHEEGQAMLREIVSRRMAPNLIADVALGKLVESSGGLLVTLIDLTQRAIVSAIGQRREQVTEADVDKAIVRERSDYQALLSNEHYDALRQRRRDKKLVNDETVRDLLYNQSLLEYANGDPWCDVHPVVWPLLEE
jgi:nucleoside-triphosphatase THEP1